VRSFLKTAYVMPHIHGRTGGVAFRILLKRWLLARSERRRSL
jgi:hypothetical protein